MYALLVVHARTEEEEEEEEDRAQCNPLHSNHDAQTLPANDSAF